MPLRRFIAASALALALAMGSAGASLAQDASACPATSLTVREADEGVFATLSQEINAGGSYGAIQRHERALKAAMSHAPSTPDELAACGGLEAGWKDSIYPQIAFLLGALNVEHGRFEEAHRVMQQGLLMSPNDYVLSAEDSQALIRLRRYPEALALVDASLAANPTLDARSRARLLRSRGFSLGELSRFDEAEAAYRESLRLEPGNTIATNELEYLRRRRAGEAPSPPRTVNESTGEVSAGDRSK